MVSQSCPLVGGIRSNNSDTLIRYALTLLVFVAYLDSWSHCRGTLTRAKSAEQVPHFLMDVSETRRYIKNLRGENRALKLEIKEYQKENARLHKVIKTLETQAVENLKEQGFIK